MEYLLNGREMKQFDENTIHNYGISSEVLMERAALGVLQLIEEKPWKDKKILVVCGTGNNGGDGYALARMLFLKGYHVGIYSMGEVSRMTEECRKQKNICDKLQIPFWNSYESFGDSNLIIDGLFGIGLKREIQGAYKELLEKLNDMDAIRIAIDIPSGVCADDGMVSGIAFYADYTVTFGYKKIGHTLYPGKEYCGEVILQDIGIINPDINGAVSFCRMPEKRDLELLPRAKVNSNKGSAGKVLLVAGSEQMAGAAYLAGLSALTCGCGMVKIYTHKKNRDVILSLFPEAVVVCYEKFDEKQLVELMKWATGIAIGPGIGTSPLSKELVDTVVKYASVPVVIDADGLNVIAKNKGILKQPHTDIVVTPHIVEMARLTDNPALYVTEHKISVCQEFAAEHQVICVLKDGATLTAVPYEDIFINGSGCPAMATAGSGDVLTGIIVSLIAQGLSAALAAPLGVYLHGLAGEAAAKSESIHGMVASDIIGGMKMIYLERGL